MTDTIIEDLFAAAIEASQRAAVARGVAAQSMQDRRAAVASLREIGVSYQTIADRLGITRSGVQKILTTTTSNTSA